MRIISALLLAACAVCTGCAASGLRSDTFTAQGSGHYWRHGQGPRGYARRGEERVALGLSFGSVLGVSTEAVDGFHDSEFESGTLTGGSLTIFFPTHGYGQSQHFVPRYGVELRLDDYGMLLSEDGFEFGTLNITSTTIAFAAHWLPPEMQVFGFHFDVGFGWGTTRFKKDSMLIADELAFGYTTEVNPGPAGIFTFGGGVDFFLSPQMCLSLDLRQAFVATDVEWYEDGILRPEIEWFDATNTQVCIGLRVFF